jgi:potassium-transporting ATPase KdpC subunit
MIDADKCMGAAQQIMTAGRVALVTMVICCLLYGLGILSFGQSVMPNSADGSLVCDDGGKIVGSELIAQGFSRPEYFWPRPSAVDYSASAAGGSNLSPTNPKLRLRAEAIMAKMGTTSENPLPADLATASGSGLDPHITLAAAQYQAERIAAARGLSITTVMRLLERYAKRPMSVLTPEPVINVLLVNMALDRLGK